MILFSTPRTNRTAVWTTLLVAAIGFVRALSASDLSAVEQSGVIHLVGGDHAPGRLVDSNAADRLSWQAPGFARPFDFRIDAVQRVQFPAPDVVPQPVGKYRIELAGGDVLFGTLAGLEEHTALLEITGLGRLHVDGSVLRRMSRWNGGTDVVYFGPSGLEGWKSADPARPWREDAGQLLADQDGAAVYREIKIPPQARIEFELSWSRRPDFSVVLGVGANPARTDGYRLEVWDKQLVALRETESAADLAALQELSADGGRLHLQAFLDQPKGWLVVMSSSGQPLGELTVPPGKNPPGGGLQFINGAGDLRLERLQVSRWNGEVPQAVEASRSRVHLSDGSIRYGELQGYDAARSEFTIRDGEQVAQVSEAQLQDLFFASTGDVAPRAFRAVQVSGQRISGDLLKVDHGKLWLQCPGIAEPLASAVADLHSVQSHPLRKAAERVEVAGEGMPRKGRLESVGLSLQGSLIDTPSEESGRLIWRPVQSVTASPLERGAAARIVYRERRSTAQTAIAVPTRPVAQVKPAGPQGLLGLLFGGGTPPRASRPVVSSTVPPGGKAVLHLRTGDTLPCTVSSISEEGVTFRTEVSQATFARHEQIKALELQPHASPVTISRTKAERLLVLPRAQRDNAPTQLLRSVGGDYLRGRLLAMDDKEITVEVRLEERKLQRDRVARIIWLHSDELTSTDQPTPADAAAETVTRVQAIPSDGNRLTFVAETVEGQVLLGRSELLGACRVELAKVDELLIGPAIDEAAVTLAFQQWRLTAAPDPLEAPDGEGGGTDGLESALVGKPAPDIDLEMLDGSKFQLARLRNKIVVLDFWATWCGPCLQTMPQVEQVVREFAGRDVELVGINLEETPERVKPLLERLKLDLPVAFDRDGRVAERYGATSIPQTVIIDRDGNVARLFVGGGPRFDETLRAALEAVLAGPAEPMQ